MGNNWKTEIINKVPWSATFLVAAFCFFKFSDQYLVGWICIVVAIIALFLVIRFDYYEKIIDRQEKQIKQYCDQAIDNQVKTTQILTDANTSLGNNIGYKRYIDNPTDTR